MLAIRMQRTGRRGHAMFRMVVQDSRYTPTSGKVVANLGHYDPHTKAVVVDKDKASFYLTNGAQPSDRVARLLKKEGVKLPDWVVLSGDKKRATKNAEKLRKNQPKEEKPAEDAEQPATEAAEATAETTDEVATLAEEATEASEETSEEVSKDEAAEEEKPADNA